MLWLPICSGCELDAGIARELLTLAKCISVLGLIFIDQNISS